MALNPAWLKIEDSAVDNIYNLSANSFPIMNNDFYEHLSSQISDSEYLSRNSKENIAELFFTSSKLISHSIELNKLIHEFKDNICITDNVPYIQDYYIDEYKCIDINNFSFNDIDKVAVVITRSDKLYKLAGIINIKHISDFLIIVPPTVIDSNTKNIAARVISKINDNKHEFNLNINKFILPFSLPDIYTIKLSRNTHNSNEKLKLIRRCL